jgi:hypothetical protein
MNEWMPVWSGGGVWVLAAIGILVLLLLAVSIIGLIRK